MTIYRFPIAQLMRDARLEYDQLIKVEIVGNELRIEVKERVV